MKIETLLRDVKKEIIAITAGGNEDINLDRIFTPLIQSAGKNCQSYASDILYDINNIKNYILAIDIKEYNFYVGIRAMGTHHTTYIESKEDISGYLDLFQIKIEHYKDNDTKVTLYKYDILY